MPLVETTRATFLQPSASMTPCSGAVQGQDPYGSVWTYLRDNQPFGGPDPRTAAYFHSRDRGGEHPEQHLASYAGSCRRTRLCGFQLALRIVEAVCWAHARRKFFDLARPKKAPIGGGGGGAHRCAVRRRARVGTTPQVRVRVRNDALVKKIVIENDEPQPLHCLP